MKNTIVSVILTFVVMSSLASCYYYFKWQFSLYSIKVDTFSDLKLEKEHVFRVPRAKPLKVFRPPKVIPGFIAFTTETLRLSDKLYNNEVDNAGTDVPESLKEQAKKVTQLEALVKNYVKDGYDLMEMKAFGYVSKTLTARLIACYNVLADYGHPSLEIQRLKEVIKTILVENSDVTYFEIMATFEDTLSAFPDVAINIMGIVENLSITSDEKISYFSRFLNRRLSERISHYDLDRERSIHLALEKLKKFGVDQSQVNAWVDMFIRKNADDPIRRRHAIAITNGILVDNEAFGLED